MIRILYWISTEKGLARFNKQTQHFRNYTIADGLASNEFNFFSALKSSDGKFYFGGTSGLISFYPKKLKDNLFPPNTHITNIKIAGNSYSKNLQNNSTLKLSYDQNDLDFEYVGLHYTIPSKNQYKYKLEPYDSHWIEVGNQRSARYTNLDPGAYTFKVTSSNSDGIWNEQTSSIKLLITPPWWETWWAYLLFLVILCSLAYSFFYFQLSKNLAIAESKRLKEIDSLKSSLYTNITHEFRTPLTVILGMVENLKSLYQKRNFPEAAKHIEMIERNSKNLLQLVKNMLDLSKLENGKMEMNLVQSDIIPFIKYLSESFQSLAQRKEINLVIYPQINSLSMDFDPEKLTTILSNLLSNAIKFTPKNGKIIVHLMTAYVNKKDHFQIKVMDSGIGLAKAELENIFTRFYQVDASVTRHGEGTGVGLSLTKELVELMDGNISVESAPKQGSTFIIQLPITQNAEVKTTIQEFKKPSTQNPEFITKTALSPLSLSDEKLPVALLIEDNQDVIYYLASCLKGKYQTVHALDGLKGIEMALDLIPDIIICDVMMPLKDGFEVCGTLKNDERTDHIPIIMLTAKITDQDRLTGLSLGADAYLAKPFKKVELLTRIDQLILLRKKLIAKLNNNPFNQFLTKRTKNKETLFVQKVIKYILEDIDNPNLGAAYLGLKLKLSESQIYRKLKAITGKSPALFIRAVRLQQAKETIKTSDKNISEVAYAMGFQDPSWFSRVYKEEFGFSPSETPR